MGTVCQADVVPAKALHLASLVRAVVPSAPCCLLSLWVGFLVSRIPKRTSGR